MARIACLLALVLVASAAAQINPYQNKCGQLNCQYDEYCSSETNRCASCVLVCNSTHHNHDSLLCVKECQGYLLDLRYLRRTEYEEPVTDVGSAQRQARTALIISGIALAILLLILIIICQGKISWRAIKQRFQPSKNRIKHYPADLTHRNPHADLPKPKPKPELRLEIRNPDPPARNAAQPLNVRDLEKKNSQSEGTQSIDTSKTANTAISTRHPAEDVTLDFSYDNMAMNVIPSEQSPGSNKF